MRKKVIALQGVSKMGKSEVVKKVYDLLKAGYPQGIILLEKNYKVDITAILNIKGIKIGIESQGDPYGNLEKGILDRFVREGCNVIICATRTHGKTVDVVAKLQQLGYRLVWLQQVKVGPTEREASNLVMANRIMKEAEELFSA
jgi:hypothetical protein